MELNCTSETNFYKNIRFLVMDVDGTLTDGKIYMGNRGELLKAFDIKDGCGIKEILPEHGILPVIITARNSGIVKYRCEELDIAEYHQGCRNKTPKLREIIENYSEVDGCIYSFANVAYIGDDVMDIPCMLAVKSAGGIVACPSDAAEKVLHLADYICLKRCGEGAIREFIEWLVSMRDESARGLDVVRKLSTEAYDFIVSFSPSLMKDGRYELGNGVDAQVMSYITKPIAFTTYETHRKYIEIQHMVFGAELLARQDISKLASHGTTEYDEERDVILFDYSGGDVELLKAGETIIFYPKDAHRGAMAFDYPRTVRKIVIKIPVSP